MTLILVRHGQTAVNAEGRLQGRIDAPLTDLGRRQSAASGAALPAEVSRVVVSPLLRARQTAEAFGLPSSVPVEVDERWIELDYGEWDTTSFADLPPDALAQWRSDPTFAPPGGESLRAVTARVADFCTEMLDGPHSIAVSHVSPIKAAVTWALDAGELLGWRMFLELASITRIGSQQGHGILLGYNDTAHLEGDERAPTARPT